MSRTIGEIFGPKREARPRTSAQAIYEGSDEGHLKVVKATRIVLPVGKTFQHATRKDYAFVQAQDWKRRWPDADFHSKCSLSASEIAFKEKMVCPVDLTISDNDD